MKVRPEITQPAVVAPSKVAFNVPATVSFLKRTSLSSSGPLSFNAANTDAIESWSNGQLLKSTPVFNLPVTRRVLKAVASLNISFVVVKEDTSNFNAFKA